MNIVLLHSGVTDAGEWDDARALLERTHDVVAPELWQKRPLVELVLEAIPGERAALVGTSFGGRGALEAAAAAPERVSHVVLIGTNPFGWSEEVRALGEEENALFEAGRRDEAAEVMVRGWLVGARRDVDAVPRELRERVFAMQRRAYELDQAEGGDFELEDVRAPVLYIRGELDWPDVERAAARFPNAQQAVVEGAAHLPTMEKPDEVARLVQEFVS